jgi:hypothetical protein
MVNVPQAAATAACKTQGVVSNRLDRIHEFELENLTPPAAAKISTASGPADLGCEKRLKIKIALLAMTTKAMA